MLIDESIYQRNLTMGQRTTLLFFSFLALSSHFMVCGRLRLSFILLCDRAFALIPNQMGVNEKLIILADEVYQANIWKEGSSFSSFKKVGMDLRTIYKNEESRQLLLAAE